MYKEINMDLEINIINETIVSNASHTSALKQLKIC